MCSFKIKKIWKGKNPNAEAFFPGSNYGVNTRDLLWNVCQVISAIEYALYYTRIKVKLEYYIKYFVSLY